MKLRQITPLLLALTLVGCASNSQESSTVSTTQNENTSSVDKSSLAKDLDLPEEFLDSSVTPDVNSALAAMPLINFEDVKTAFQEDGYTLSEETPQDMELTFVAQKGNDRVNVYVEKMETTEQANSFVQDKVAELEGQGYTLESNPQSSQADGPAIFAELFIFNTGNNGYTYIGVDNEANRVYMFETNENIPEFENVLHSLGFATL